MSAHPETTLVEHPTSIDDVDAVFASAAGHLNVQHARLVSAAAWMLDNIGSWQGDGLWTPEAYLRWRTGVSHGVAAKVINVARRASEFPECITVMERGEISLDQIAPIARLAPGWCDAQMSSLAPRCTVSQISKMAGEYPWDHELGETSSSPPEPEPDCEGAPDHGLAPDRTAPVAGDATLDSGSSSPVTTRPAIAPDEAWFGWDDHGRFRLHANLGADSGSLIEAALSEARDALFQSGSSDVDTIDALLEVAERSIDSIPAPERRARYRVNVHMTEDGSVTDSRGRPISPTAAARITCDALASPVLFDNGVPVSVGRSQHIVPDRTRRLVEHRDGGCRVPGCHSDRFVEVHHITHWSQHGPTDTWNLVCLCPKHHRLHHQGRLGISGDADVIDAAFGGVSFTDRHGKALAESGARPEPPGAPPPPIRGTYEHPLGERLDFRWLYFNDDPKRPKPLGRTISN